MGEKSGELKRGVHCIGKTDVNHLMETRIYRRSQRHYPQLFGDLGIQPEAHAKLQVPPSCDEAGRSCSMVSLNTGECLDDGAWPSSDKDLCGFFEIHEKTIMDMDGLSLDTASDDDPGTWELHVCNSGESQHFERHETHTWCARQGDTLVNCLKLEPRN